MIPGSPGFETEEKINQCEHDSERWFPHANHDLAFLTLCLAGEVGELANKVKKVERGSALMQAPKTLQDIVEEINDIRVYLYNVMGLSIFDGVNWETEWNRKRSFNEERFGPKESTGLVTSVTDGTQDEEHSGHVHWATPGRPIRDNPQA